MEAERGKKGPGPEEHEHSQLQESLENKESWEEVEAIISQQTNPIVALAQSFLEPQANKLEPQHNKPNIPRYHTFYRPKDDVLSME